MKHSASRTPHFFVTPQAANLMEDMSRQLAQGDDVCVLHGPAGCGKTRLLRHFRQSYLATREVREVALRQDGFAFAGDPGQLDCAEFIEKVLVPLPQNCILILDQMEQTDDNLREALFRFWQTDGIKRRCRLLIGSRSSGLVDLAIVAERSRIHLLSIELKPWDKREVSQFLNRRLCNTVDEQLEINPELRRQLKSTRGFPGAVEQLAQQLEGQINCRPRRGSVLSYLLALVLIGVALTVLYWDTPGLRESGDSVEATDSTAPGQGYEEDPRQMPGVLAAAEDQVQVGKQQVSDADSRQTLADLKETQVEAIDPKPNQGERTLAQATGAATGLVISGDLPEASNVSNPTPGTVDHRTDAVVAENLLSRRIQATSGWLAKSSGKQATIQIMSVNYQMGAVEPLKTFLNKLVVAGVEVEKLFVYSLERDSGQIYVVLYGEFADRREAFSAIEKLPPVLSSNDPIPRTVNSIRQELLAQQSAAS